MNTHRLNLMKGVRSRPVLMDDFKIRSIRTTLAFKFIIKAFWLSFKGEDVWRIFKMKAGIKLKTWLNRKHWLSLTAGKAEQIFYRGVFQSTPIHKNHLVCSFITTKVGYVSLCCNLCQLLVQICQLMVQATNLNLGGNPASHIPALRDSCFGCSLPGLAW